MIYSMTGYATQTLQINSVLIQMEIKSVNHRFLDITIKSAEEFRPLETHIRNIIGKKITRGKIDIKLFTKEDKDGIPNISLNHALLKQYLKIIQEVKAQLSPNSTISITEILSIPGILSGQTLELENLESNILDGFTNLVNDFHKTQAIEGEKLEHFLNTRLDEMSEIVKLSVPLVREVADEYRKKLLQRLQEILQSIEINDARFQQEFAFFCQKIDVSEELDRLNAHISEFKNLLTKGGSSGKRLDFICQEMHREANTFGSKSVSIPTTQKVVELKVLIEQIREQVQNIM